MPDEPNFFEPEDREAIRDAVTALENPSLWIDLANRLGVPFERLLAIMPKQVSGMVQDSTREALRRALNAAVYGMERTRPRKTRRWAYKAVVAGTGAVGGYFGVPALAVELPVSTTVMLRAIAAIAREEGEDLGSMETRLACLSVFALGGRTDRDDSADAAYWAIRAALAKSVADAATFIAERGLAEESAPVLVRLLAQIASRFGIVVSEKAAAQTVPVVGAAGGASVNLLFMTHFQKVARAHFTLRRLERTYGTAAVKAEYERIQADLERKRNSEPAEL